MVMKCAQQLHFCGILKNEKSDISNDIALQFYSKILFCNDHALRVNHFSIYIK